MITNRCSSSPLEGAVDCSLEDGCRTLLSSSSIWTYDTVKNTCCIRSSDLLEGGVWEMRWGVGLTGFCFYFNSKNVSLLFFVCIVITLKYCICIKNRLDVI